MNIEKHKGGIKLSKENSGNLFKCAELLASNYNYGTAISLLVLSGEEIIKSFAYCLEFFLGDKSDVKKIIKDSKLKAIDSYLFNHTEKHKLGKALIQDLNNVPFELRLIKPFLPQKIKELLELILLPANKREQVNSLLTGFDSFNDLKNQGLYVDNVNDEWQTPSSFSESDYNKYKGQIDLIREIFSPKIDHALNMPNEEWTLLLDAYENV